MVGLMQELVESFSIEHLAAISTLLAAIAAIFSAWTSRISAKAAKESVAEIREARRTELAPKLTLEKQFVGFELSWPHPKRPDGHPVFLAKRDWKDHDPRPPTFILHNYGQSPALELVLVFELDDPNGDLSVPERYGSHGLKVEDDDDGRGNPQKLLYFPGADNSGHGIPLYKKWTTDIALCGANQSKEVEFPMQLLARVYLRGLQRWDKLVARETVSDVALTVHISCHAVDKHKHETQFRWNISPYQHSRGKPVVVYGHCWELPMYPKPIGPRVE